MVPEEVLADALQTRNHRSVINSRDHWPLITDHLTQHSIRIARKDHADQEEALTRLPWDKGHGRVILLRLGPVIMSKYERSGICPVS